jgi:hypothetical protein
MAELRLQRIGLVLKVEEGENAGGGEKDEGEQREKHPWVHVASKAVEKRAGGVIVKATSSRTNLDWKKTVKKLILNNIFLDHSVRFLTDFTIKNPNLPDHGLVVLGATKLRIRRHLRTP